MDHYKVIFQLVAAEDIREIYHHLANDLNEPLIAKKLQQSFISASKDLEIMPNRHQLIAEEPYRSKGLRILKVKNYSMFYKVDNVDRNVYIVRVLYSRREWKNLV